MIRKSILAAAAAALMSVSLLGITASAEDMCASYLTGKQVPVSVGRQRPIGLMIENDSEAVQWQHGTSYADIMYEAMVEGGITRLEGLFEDYKDAEKIMPIRSCRPYYIYYAREFNAYYGHFGQVIYAVPILQQPTTCDLAGLPWGEDGQNYELHDGSASYIRDHEGVTGIYTNYDLIQQGIESAGWDKDYASGYTGHYQFAADGETVSLDNGKPCYYVNAGFSNEGEFSFNPEDLLYYRSEFGSPQIDQLNGKQLAYNNIIIQVCPSTMFDDHYLWTDPAINGEVGTGWFITNGQAEKITWQKEFWSADDPILTTISSANISFDVRLCDFNVTRYYDENGNEIVLNQGKTFVEVVREQDVDFVQIQ